MPDEAATVFEKCINEKALVLSGKVCRDVDALCFATYLVPEVWTAVVNDAMVIFMSNLWEPSCSPRIR